MNAMLHLEYDILCMITRDTTYFARSLDVWRAIEVWSIVTTTEGSPLKWPPVGRMGRRDEDMIWWETPEGTFLFPYESVRQVMAGELREAMAVRAK